MRLLLISSIILFYGQICLYGQEVFDEIAIHINTNYVTPGFNECDKNENYLRVNSNTSIRIKEKNQIYRIQKIMFDDSVSIIEKHEFIMSCQMVVDFIKDGRIQKTVAISQENEIRIDEDKSIYYSSKAIENFRDEYLEFFTK